MKKKRRKNKMRREAKLSRMRKPENMSLEDWQIELRRQFGKEQPFSLKNIGSAPVFSEFEVTNPLTQRSYRVQIRGRTLGENSCSCPDFTINALGTCKHIEFALARLERHRSSAALLRAGHQPLYSEVFVQYGARREVRFRPGTECPRELSSLAGAYFGPDGALLPEAFGRFETFLADAKAAEPELRCQDDVLTLVAEVRDATNRAQRIAEEFPRGTKSAAFKNLVSVSLYDYQREGALFAARAGRCLIGDEMGLGKTVQAISAAEIMARLFGVERALIICPTSLKHQWQREIERFVKRTVQVIGGARRAREQGFASDTFFKIINYDTVHMDLDLIEDWGPDLVILDEAQRIKNWNTRVAQSVKRIVSPYAIVLTGTPLENRLEELISIVEFVDRYRLGPTYRLLHEHQVRDPYGKVVGYQNLDRIGRTLEPVLLRRQKDQVLNQLPERIDTNIYVPMTELQRKHHTENMEIVARVVQKWRRLGFLSEADKQRLMIALQMMRMACDNSYLVDHETDQGPKADEATTLLAECFERPETKVVVFSQWLRMHELLVRRMSARGMEHVVFHGGVPSAKRKDLVDQFRDDPSCRAFLATDAGGVGLNLQHASVVLNMDLPWNPAVLEQRIGRVHRLGQRQPVRVVNFVSQGTIEEGMLSVLKFKKSLFAGVLDGGDKDVFMGGTRFTKFMEGVEAATRAIPESMADDPAEITSSPTELTTTAADQATSNQTSRGKRIAPPAAGAAPTHSADPWSSLLQAGMALLQQVLGAGSSIPSSQSTGATAIAGAAALVHRDERTGESYLKLPVPPPDVVEQALRAMEALVQNWRR